MVTWAIMLALVAGIAASVLAGARFDEAKRTFMSLDDAVFLRGFWCLIVALVHVPKAYRNPVQDAVGSLAFVGVTFFFMTSAFGLKVSLARKPGYMRRFWRERLPAILVPALLAKAVAVAAKLATGRAVTLSSLVEINDWVKILLGGYVAFWIVYGLLPRWIRPGRWQDAALCAAALAYSLTARASAFGLKLGWVVEPLGFAAGIVAANHADAIADWTRRRWPGKAALLALLSGALGAAYLKFKAVPLAGDYLLRIALGAAITALIFQAIARLRVGNRLNRFLGGLSYEVFLLHRTVFNLAAALAKGGPKPDSGAFIAASLAVTIALAWGVKKLSDALVGAIRRGTIGA